jgi:vacuolar-type H+-ATPase subunit C/Vma6
MRFGSTPYVASRAKARKNSLADRARLRQIIHQNPDQLTVAVADLGYRAEIDRYAATYDGGDLVEAALSDNLAHELDAMMDLCSGAVERIVSVYTGRFEYHNAKAVLRAVLNEVEADKVGHDILPDLNDLNTPWLQIVERSDSLRAAATLMRRKAFGPALMALPEDATLAAYEDALDRHYFANALSALGGSKPDVRMLKDLLATEIDHRNIINLLEADAMRLEGTRVVESLIPGGRLIPKRAFTAVSSGGRASLMEVLRGSNRFDMNGFEAAVKASDEAMSLDPVITWLGVRETAHLSRMSYLHPVSALPVVHYIAMKVQEVKDLRIITRGLLAGLPADVVEAHVY